jgi:uncharacterized protein (TIGR02453 family)
LAYFDKRFYEFFEGLALENNKAYFDVNRKTYQTAVREPFVDLVGDMIMRIGEHEPELQIQPKEAIFRINRDIRFSKDKTPYKTHVGAHISRGGRKDHQYPGFYFQLGHDRIMVAGGVWMPDKDGVYKVRTHIANNPEKFAKVIKTPVFKKTFGEVLGDRLKRIPPEFKEAFEVQPYVGNKAWYYHTDIGPEVIVEDRLPDVLMDHYLAGQSVAGFLRDALVR